VLWLRATIGPDHARVCPELPWNRVEVLAELSANTAMKALDEVRRNQRAAPINRDGPKDFVHGVENVPNFALLVLLTGW
jgi:hypothetical protein